MNTELLLAVLAGIALLLILILVVRLHAFLALLITSISVGLMAGMNGAEIADTVQKGMAGTLGFVAVVDWPKHLEILIVKTPLKHYAHGKLNES